MYCMGLLIFGFFGFGLSEYHYINLPMKWTDAQHYCRVKYTDLATIESKDDTTRLKRPSSVTSWVWIGLTDDPKSWKTSMGDDANSWKWSTTGEMSKTGYQNWREGQPNDFSSRQICVAAVPEGNWMDLSCERTYYTVCYDDTVPPGQKTYTLVKISLTWKDAQTYCRTHHTDLAMIESARENAEMMSANAVYTVWIGLSRVPWRWSDKSNSSFSNWLSGSPDNHGGKQYCAAENSHHVWNDIGCHNEFSFWCHGALKVKMTMIRMKIQTVADLSDPATNAQILQQLGAVVTNKTSLTDFNLRWKTQPRKQDETTG